MTALGQLFGQHVPRNRYDDEGHPVGTYCICGGWEGDYLADGEAGPFDEHLAAVVLAWVLTEGWKAPEAAVEAPVSDLGAESVRFLLPEAVRASIREQYERPSVIEALLERPTPTGGVVTFEVAEREDRR